MKRRTFTTLSVLAALAAAPAQAQTEVDAVLRGEGSGLSADEVARRAVERAPARLAADASIDAAGAGVQEAWAAIVPQIVLSGRYTRLSEIENDPLVSGLGGGEGTGELVAAVDDPEARALWAATLAQTQSLSEQRIPVIVDQISFDAAVSLPASELFLSLLPQLEAAEAAVDAERARREVVEATVDLRAREAFYGTLRARALLAVAAQHERETEEQARLARRGFEEGVTRRSEMLGARAQLAAARAARVQAASMVESAEAALRSLLGVAPDAPVAIAEDLSAPLAPDERSAASLIDAAFERRPEARALRHGMRAQRSARAAAEGARYPALRVVFNAQVANPNSRYVPQRAQFDPTWDLSVVLAWSPNQTIAADARARRAGAEAARLEAELAGFRDALHREVADAHAADAAAAARLEQARASLEAAEEALRAREAERAAGEALTSEVLEAQTAVANARLLHVDAAVSARLARARLEFAIGTPR